MLPPQKVYAYLYIHDALGTRTVYLNESHYLIGGGANCDIQLISPSAPECQTVFVRSGTDYKVVDIDLQQRGTAKHKPYEGYNLQHGDCIVFAPHASATYLRSFDPPPDDSGVGARLPATPSSFPPMEKAKPSESNAYPHEPTEFVSQQHQGV